MKFKVLVLIILAITALTTSAKVNVEDLFSYDRKRNIGKDKSFFEKLTKQGGQANLDVENSCGHRQTCEWSFTPERLAWLFCCDDEKNENRRQRMKKPYKI